MQRATVWLHPQVSRNSQVAPLSVPISWVYLPLSPPLPPPGRYCHPTTMLPSISVAARRQKLCRLFVCCRRLLLLCIFRFLSRFRILQTFGTVGWVGLGLGVGWALAALYLTLGSLMAGNRILMDFVISSKSEKLCLSLLVSLRFFAFAFGIFFCFFTWKIVSFVVAIDIFATEVFHKVDGLIKLLRER